MSSRLVISIGKGFPKNAYGMSIKKDGVLKKASGALPKASV
jgi:hypothetical protein